MRVAEQEQQSQVDITSKYLQALEEYRNVFIQKIGNDVFVYRSIGRGEYKKIISDDRFTIPEKEDMICSTCLLWPENADMDEYDAGVPTILAQVILKRSLLDSLEAQANVLAMYRDEMWEIGNQITCIIAEAFPQQDIEDIENWDIEQTLKYLSRAEWVLLNLRGANIDPNYFELAANAAQASETQTEELDSAPPEAPAKPVTNTRGDAKEPLTPEKLRELQAKFPEINWAEDAVVKDGIKALEFEFDTTSPALRPGL